MPRYVGVEMLKTINLLGDTVPTLLTIRVPATFTPKPEIQEPRLQLIEALMDLLILATGAGDCLFLQGRLFVSTVHHHVLNASPLKLILLVLSVRR